MKPLSQMTREELWALDADELGELAVQHALRVSEICLYQHGYLLPHTQEMFLTTLEALRLELQQDSADSRQDR